jgi:glycosyltransferase involved in cell wall biosynthesis
MWNESIPLNNNHGDEGIFVSVIINCFNGEEFLEFAIDSVLSQTHKNFELIIWDNQSSDNSAEVVKKYKDNRINYYCASKHTTLGQARNLAVAKASGDWIGFLDCDDIWYKNKLEMQLCDVCDNTGMIYSRSKFLVEDSGQQTTMGKSIKKNLVYPSIKKLPFGNIFNELLYECFIPMPSVLIRRSLFFEVGGIDPAFCVAEDYDIFLKIANISNVISIDSVLCEYRVHGNNLSHSNLDVTFSESIRLVDSYKSIYNTDIQINYWRLKQIKNLFKQRKFRILFAELFKLRFYAFFKMLVNKYL